MKTFPLPKAKAYPAHTKDKPPADKIYCPFVVVENMHHTETEIRKVLDQNICHVFASDRSSFEKGKACL